MIMRTLVLLLVIVAGQARAADKPMDWQVSIFGGAHNWSALSDLEPVAGGGSFDTTGWNLGIAGHRPFRKLGSGELGFMIEGAFFTNDSDIRGFDDDLTSRGFYLAPALEWSWAGASQSRVDLDVGVGLYVVDFVELIDCENFCAEGDEVFEATRMGGFVGAGYEFPPSGWGSVFLRLRAHFVDFGDIDELGPDAGELDGPILMLHVGVRWGR